MIFILNPYRFFSNTKSMLFDGVDEEIDLGIGHILFPPGTTKGSWSAWFKSSSSSAQVILSKYDGRVNDIPLLIRIESNVIKWISRISGTLVSRVSSSTVNDNQWHHLACIFKGSTNMDIYLDGVLNNGTLSGTIPASLSTVSFDNTIGKVGDVGGSPFNGNIDEVSIWDKGLSSDEVTEIYNSACPNDLSLHSATANLLSWWRMGEGATFSTNWTIPDEKGSNTGTSVNMEESDRVIDTIC